MGFFSIRDRYLDMLLADSKTERVKQGALMVGAMVANTVIGAGNVAGMVVKKLPEIAENEKVRIEAERRKRSG